MLNTYSENTVLLDRKEARTARIQKIFQISSKEEMASQLLKEYRMVLRGEEGSSVLRFKSERVALQIFLSDIMQEIMDDMDDLVFNSTISQQKYNRMNIENWFQKNKEESLSEVCLEIHDSVSYAELKKAMQDYGIKQEIAYINQLVLEEQPFIAFQTLIEKAEQAIEEIKEIKLSKLLCVAAEEGQVEELKILLEEGAVVNQADNDGATPLWIASKAGHVEIVKILLEKGAAVDKADNDGITPLYVASKSGHVAVIQKLLKLAGESISGEDKGKALQGAASYKQGAVVQALLSCCGKDIKSEDKLSALEDAERRGELEIVSVLKAHLEEDNLLQSMGRLRHR